MTTFPSPLVPTVQPRPILPHPYEAIPDGLNGWWVDGPTGRIGRVFPKVVAHPRGDWYGHRFHRGEPARLFKSVNPQRMALAHVCGCDPDDIDFEEAR